MEDLRKQSADALTQVAEALSALRHIATLIARGVPSAELFNAVAAELGQLIGTDGANIVRYEDDGTATVVAAWGWWHDVPIPVGTSLSLEGRNVSATVRHTGRPARIDSYTNAPDRSPRCCASTASARRSAPPSMSRNASGASWQPVRHSRHH